MSSSGKIIQRSGKEKLSSIITDLHYRFTESLPKLCMAQTMNGKLEHFFSMKDALMKIMNWHMNYT